MITNSAISAGFSFEPKNPKVWHTIIVSPPKGVDNSPEGVDGFLANFQKRSLCSQTGLGIVGALCVCYKLLHILKNTSKYCKHILWQSYMIHSLYVSFSFPLPDGWCTMYTHRLWWVLMHNAFRNSFGTYIIQQYRRCRK